MSSLEAAITGVRAYAGTFLEHPGLPRMHLHADVVREVAQQVVSSSGARPMSLG